MINDGGESPTVGSQFLQGPGDQIYHTSTRGAQSGRTTAMVTGTSGSSIPSRSLRRITRVEVSAESGALWLEVDGRFYGSTQNLGHQDIATGRIYGISASDVSAYVARDLFYDRISKNRDALVMVREDHEEGIGNGWANEAVLENCPRSHYWTHDVEDQFSNVWFYSGHGEVDGNQATIRFRYEANNLRRPWADAGVRGSDRLELPLGE